MSRIWRFVRILLSEALDDLAWQIDRLADRVDPYSRD